jgi:predicted RNase H-like HicB family nuclease
LSAFTKKAQKTPAGDRARLESVKLTVDFDREVDGRWIAEVCDLPGVMAYGRTRKDALGKVQAIAFAVLSADVKRGRRDPKTLMLVQFVPRAA